MRSIVLAVALASSTLLASVRPADACGGGFYQWSPTARAIVTPEGKRGSFALTETRELTLLGPAGTEVFTARPSVALDGERPAVRLPKGNYVIALEGHYQDATWTPFRVTHGSTVTSFLADNVHVTTAHGGPRSFLMDGVSVSGTPLGIVTVRKKRYIAVATGDSRSDVVLRAL